MTVRADSLEKKERRTTFNGTDLTDPEGKALKEIASILVHKLRNPLGGIKGFAALLEGDLADQPNLQKLATMIVKGTDQLNDLLTVILNYAEPLEINPVESDLIAFMKKLAKGKPVSVQTADQSFSVLIDDAHMQKAFSHLMTFATESTQGKGTVLIDMKSTEGNAVVTISDKGMSLPEERLSKVFSPFFIAPWGGQEGAIANVKKIVRAHGGSIDLLSNPDKSIAFIIKLPIKRG